MVNSHFPRILSVLLRSGKKPTDVSGDVKEELEHHPEKGVHVASICVNHSFFWPKNSLTNYCSKSYFVPY